MSSPQPPRPDDWRPPSSQPDADPGPPAHPSYPPPGTAYPQALLPGAQYPPPGGYVPPPPYPPPTYSAARSGSRRRWGKALTIVGAVLLVVGLAFGVWFARSVEGLVPTLDQSTRVSGSTSVTLTGDDMLILYSPTTMMPTCDIFGPTEQIPDIDLGTTYYSFTFDGVTYESIAKLGGPGQPGGEYVVECVEEGLFLAPPLRIGGILGTFAVLVAAFGAGTLGGTLLAVGVILLVSSGRNRE